MSFLLRPRLALLCGISLELFVVGADAGTLTGSIAEVPTGSNVDLSTLGAIDWVHWGLYTDSSIDRKSGVTPQIGDFALLDNTNGYAYVYQYADNFNGYSWRDGVPTEAVTNTTTGVWAYGIPTIGSGFEFRVPAETGVRTIKVFVGSYAARGRFEASLSDGSAAGYTNTSLSNFGNGPGAVYTIDFAANAAGQYLKIRWLLSTANRADGNVTLQAAALSSPTANNPPVVTITAPADNSIVSAGTSLPITIDAFDLDGSVSKVEVFANDLKLGEKISGPFSLNWNSVAGAYRLTAVATDNGGAKRTSRPIDLFVHGNGGTLIGSSTTAPSSTDLTGEGTADWAHWGLNSATSFDRKAGVTPQVGALTVLGTNTVQQLSNNVTAFSWTDGTPTPAVAGTPTGIYVTGYTNGFEFTVPAGTTARHLKVHVGLYGARGSFQAFLSDASAPAFIDESLDSIYGDRHNVYVLDFAAATAGQRLVVRYRSTAVYDFDYGNVALASVTLSGDLPNPPAAPTIHSITMDGNTIRFSFSTETNHGYLVQFTDSLTQYDWKALTNFAGTGFTATVSDSTAGGERFYRVVAQ
jgi:hypothetical protein